MLLCNLRLLEAAGACELIAHRPDERDQIRPREWWDALAAAVRSYRAAIYLTSSRGIDAIDDWSLLLTSGAEPSEVKDEKDRLALEYRRWLIEVTGGRAYVMWLRAYVAMAELDGERAYRSLESCTAIIREFVETPAIDQQDSAYDLLQASADSLPRFLPLANHPMRGLRRFGLMPGPLGTGYGSRDALDIHSHRRPGNPSPNPA